MTQVFGHKNRPLPDPTPERQDPLSAFLQFLKDYSVLALAIGVVSGQAVNALVVALVSGLITPFIALFLPGKLGELAFTLPSLYGNPQAFNYGQVINALISFLIIMALIYFSVKFVLRQEELLKKK